MTEQQQQIKRTATFITWISRLGKFGAVGALSYVIDIGLFNLLVHSSWAPFEEKPVTGKVISVVVATIVSWIGNRYWTFKEERAGSVLREFVLFALVNGGGILISAGSLWFSRYVLGYTSPLADNISANIIGVGLGTIFRYLCYRYLVFGTKTPRAELAEGDPDEVEAITAVEEG